MHCPLSAECVAFRTGRVEALPTPRRRPERPTRQVVMLLAVREDGGVLLRRRPARGVWAQLWTPPEFTDIEHARAFCTPASCASLQMLPLVRHAFTHFDLEITPLRATWTEANVREPAAEKEATDSLLWYHARRPARIGIPAPIASLLRSLSAPADSAPARAAGR
jgi:A/G-specific adenine glycosylase